jgi:hypothetical protein
MRRGTTAPTERPAAGVPAGPAPPVVSENDGMGNEAGKNGGNKKPDQLRRLDRVGRVVRTAPL